MPTVYQTRRPPAERVETLKDLGTIVLRPGTKLKIVMPWFKEGDEPLDGGVWEVYCFRRDAVTQAIGIGAQTITNTNRDVTDGQDILDRLDELPPTPTN